MSLLLSFIAWFSFQDGFAQSLQLKVLHYNDLHSYMEDLGENTSKGGYAALKAHVDHTRQLARDAGQDFLSFNAGDFAEGNIYFWAAGGARSFQAIDLLGADATVIGNHDWLMGPAELNDLLANNPLKSPLLGANVVIPPIYSDLSKQIKPYRIFNLKGVKIGVLGITTPQVLYSWQMKPGLITNPVDSAKYWVDRLRNYYNVDFVFILSHAGTRTDKRMAQKVEGIDFIIGGHSHHYFSLPVMEKNSKSGKVVPIVQVGHHGEYYGVMDMELTPGQPLKIINYTTPEVLHHLNDPEMAKWVAQAKQEYQEVLGTSWLEQVHGRSEIMLETPEDLPTVWGDLITESIRASVGADVAINVSPFMGHDQPAGEITNATIVNAHPRAFELSHSEGWAIWDVKIPGWMITIVAEVVLKFELPLYFAGLEFELEKKSNGRNKVKNVRIDGERIRPWKKYSVAMTEGFVRGGLGISKHITIIMRKIWKSPHTVWEAIAQEVRRVGVVTKDYGHQNKIHRTMVVPPNYPTKHQGLIKEENQDWKVFTTAEVK